MTDPMPVPDTAADTATDVVILGGGLAGLSLAIQLKRRDPDIDVVVLERHRHPVREAAFKVGESTVEIAAHYFANVLGLREHLDREQIRKFGFRFFFSDGRDDIDQCTEIGVSTLLPTPSWQIDRGRFENFLGEQARSLGVDFRDGTTVREIDLHGDGDAPHRVQFARGDESAWLQARWLVDASGRAGLVKRQRGLAEANDHVIHAAWWRVDGRIDPNDWSADQDWRARCEPPDRWRSTSHLCGPGYWLWLIPLASGAHSLGIVCDAAMHPLETINSHDKAMAWLAEHQPRVAQTLAGDAHALQDFAFLRHVSYGCKQVFSAQRWALTGEAGLFLDPFYSPGSDFIAIGNGYICDLIDHDRAGRPFAARADLYQQLYLSFYETTLSLFQDQYPLFGDAQVLSLKVIWDYTYYWSLLAPLFIADRLTDSAMLSRLRTVLDRGTALNAAMQPLLRDWGRCNAAEGRVAEDGRDLDQYHIGWFRELNGALHDALDDDGFAARIAANVARMETLAAELLEQARCNHPAIEARDLSTLLGEASGTANEPGREPLLDAHWYAASVAAAA